MSGCTLGSINFRILLRGALHWAPLVQNVKEFFKNINSLPTGLSFKLTNQVTSFTQSANESKAELFILSCYWLAV